ncbi:hypothetical protein [Kaistella yonginensis]|uniref:hypothetical protein n=1 Tax=Kaistella yonginensis TaxID=658267 RepID=UPI0025B35A07|nr:hypothetical protein [Kaistella yonginensis]MDN3605915.1 hypothetical protein [Kaistella yonginensis]
MKTKNLLFVFAVLVLLTACTSYLTQVASGKKIDNRLVGVWVGSEKDKQIEGIHKNWEMNRRADGTFTLDFQFSQNGQVLQTIETGNWWIEKGKFYEFHQESGQTDAYDYTVLGPNQVKFKAIAISIEMNADSYEFIDTRK